MAQRILIADDERDLLDLVEYHLKAEGFETIRAERGDDALKLAQTQAPNLILLDIMMPGMSGLDVLKALRADDRTVTIPVICLTARADEIDRVLGLELGADDYIAKPFSPREMTLRVKAILRRLQRDPDEDTTLLQHAELSVDTERYKVIVKGDAKQLTALEYKLLTFLMQRRGRVQSRETLLDGVWGYNAYVTTRTVDTHITRLREKLDDAGRYIETVRGMGYRFTDDPQT